MMTLVNRTSSSIIGIAMLFVGCKTVNYAGGELGILDTCTPHGGTFEFRFVERTGSSANPCGPRPPESHKFGKSNIPSGLAVSDDLCSLSGTTNLNVNETQEIDLTFDSGWSTADGTIRIIKPSTCDSLYDVSVTRK